MHTDVRICSLHFLILHGANYDLGHAAMLATYWPRTSSKCQSCADLPHDQLTPALEAVITVVMTQTLVLRGEDKGWRKITEQCKDFLFGRKRKIRKRHAR